MLSKVTNPHLIIIRGLPGSGKSTLAKTYDNYKHFEADQYFIDAKGEYKFNPDLIGNAHTWCMSNVKRALNTGYNVVVSNTFKTKKEMQPYIELTQNHQIIVCRGEYQNIHGIPPETMACLKARWQE